MSIASDENGDEPASQPRFKGCIFCYSAEWLVHGAKKSANVIRRRE